MKTRLAGRTEKKLKGGCVTDLVRSPFVDVCQYGLFSCKQKAGIWL